MNVYEYEVKVSISAMKFGKVDQMISRIYTLRLKDFVMISVGGRATEFVLGRAIADGFDSNVQCNIVSIYPVGEGDIEVVDTELLHGDDNYEEKK